jgi:hypothetical protein
MTNLPSQHPTISLHLTDVTLTPLITSSSSQSHLESLTSLTTSAINSQSAAQRTNLGRLQRIMVEYPDRGAVVLHSYLDPREQSCPQRPSASSSTADGTRQSHDGNEDDEDEEATRHEAAAGYDDDASKAEDAAPTLIGVVVAGTADEAREARRAAARLERIGREFQREWAAESTERSTDDAS